MVRRKSHVLQYNSSRTLRFEACEDRHLLSANGLSTDNGADQVFSVLVSNFDSTYTFASESVLKHNDTSDNLIQLSEMQSQYGLTGKKQTIAVIDTGITSDHKAFLADHIVGGWDFAENDADFSDDGPMGGHGTHTAAIVGGSTTVYSGVAPGCDLIILRVFDDNGNGSFVLIKQALQWLIKNQDSFENPLTTINLSLGSLSSTSNASDWNILDDELKKLYESNCFIAVAAGNDYATNPTAGLAYPAISEYTVAVAATDANGKLAAFSQRDDSVICAPGYGVYSAIPDYLGNNNSRSDDFTRMTGTSMSTPIIAGCSAIIREAYSLRGYTDINQDTIYKCMVSSADQIFDSVTQNYYNRINILKAVEQVLALPFNSSESEEETVEPEKPGNSVQPVQSGNSGTGSSGAIGSDSGSTGSSGTSGNTGSGNAGTSGAITLPSGITLEKNVVTVSGSSRSDSLSIVFSENSCTITFNGQSCTLNLTDFQQIQANLAGGQDSVALTLGAGTDSIRCYREYSLIYGAGYTLKLYNAESIAIKGDSKDSIQLSDSASDDTFTYNAKAKTAAWTAGSYSWSTSGITRLAQTDSMGGTNSVTLYDGSGNDLVIANGQSVQFSGSDSELAIAGKIYLNAISINGGNDTIRLYGGEKEQSLIVKPGDVEFHNGTTHFKGTGFYYVYSYAGTGPSQAVFYDSANSSVPDAFSASFSQAKMYSSAYYHVATGFHNVTAHSSDSWNVQKDSAVLSGGSENDTLTVNTAKAELTNGSNTVKIERFANVEVKGKGGTNQLNITDAALNSYLEETDKGTITGQAITLKWEDFVRVLDL